MNKPQSSSPRARLQALQAIPERQRTEEEWDELNELEIMFAAGNRDTGQDRSGNRDASHDRGNRDPGYGRRDGNHPQQHGQGQGPRRDGGGGGGGGPGGPGGPAGPGGPGGGGRNKGQRKFHKKPKNNNPPH
jgi:hypothetical protein